MKNRKSGLTAVVTLFLITAVMAGLLALVNSVTAGPIAAAQREKTERALSGVLRECALAGDQIYTDVLGANCAGVYAILVSAIDNHTIWLRLRHVLELPVIFFAKGRNIQS